ncbi:MAG TPA: hypothetical protein PKZ39_05925, partial [Clostridia bacterium]|nr:hypothetical protein [Clostridia bacterium]
MPKLRAKQLRNAAFYVMVVLMAALTLLPFLFMLSSSFKGSEAIRTLPIRWIPQQPTLEGYVRVFNMPGFSFLRASANSLFLALASTLQAAGRNPQLPFRVALADGRQLRMFRLLRVLPGKRLVGE